MNKHMEYKYIDNIESPADLKRLSIEQLPEVCAELRDFIINELSKNPGHLASSLGAIELTVALHYVLDTPNDKLIWDVGHQAYAHKILTGRRDRFSTNRKFHGLAPFPTPLESEYDAFIAGHASNSISAALGMAVANPEVRTVAVIGDGALTGGLAYEGLNNASMIDSNLLIILNDNNMAIDPIKGGMTQYLVDITTSRVYNSWRYKAYRALKKAGIMNDRRKNKVQRFNNNIKSILSKQQHNIFSGLNLRYFGPADGHDVATLVRILQEIKDFRGPKVLHIITQKGKGYAPAEAQQTIWHAPGKFDPETGERIISKHGKLWQEVFGETLLELAKADEKIVGVTPAMPSGCSMNIMQREMPKRVFDVGIAEGHAVTFSAGLAKAGKTPVCNIYSSFLQRSYDNIIHDVALQQQHVVLAIDRAGIVGQDGATHHGLLDLAFLRPVPNMSICAPMTADELEKMLFTAAEKMDTPVAIRYPRGGAANDEPWVADKSHWEAMTPGIGRKLQEGKQAAILSIGAIGNTCKEAIEGLDVTHYDMRWLKPIDTKILDEAGQYPVVFTAEDGTVEGGLGSAVAEYFAEKGYKTKVIRIGVKDRFVEHGTPDELFSMLGMDAKGIRETIVSNI